MKRKITVLVASAMLAITNASLPAADARANLTGQNLAGEQQSTQLLAQAVQAITVISELKNAKYFHERNIEKLNKMITKVRVNELRKGIRGPRADRAKRAIEGLERLKSLHEKELQSINRRLEDGLVP